jgi:polar amino acid transport system substrate-binding protein
MRATVACQDAPLRNALIGLGMSTSLILAARTGLATPGTAMPDDVDLATLEWPPYTGEDLLGYGQTSQIFGDAFDMVDIDYTIAVIPWKRAVQGILRDHSFDAIYPLYRTPQRLDRFLLSDPVGISPLGFVHLRSTSVEWDHYEDLREYVIGYVIGYTYESRLRKMLESNQLEAISTHNDESLLRQLIAGRIELALIDHNVAHHLFKTHPELSIAADLLVYNPHLVIENTLHVGFPKTEDGHHLRRQFNQGLRMIDCSNHDCGSVSTTETLSPQLSLPLAEATKSQ